MTSLGAELHRVCHETAAQFGVCGATVTVMSAPAVGVQPAVPVPDSDEALAAASNAVARALAERQFDLGEGPSRDAFSTNRIVVATDLAAPAVRWTAWAPVARAAGVNGVYALPLNIGAARLGVFTCYTGTGTGTGTDSGGVVADVSVRQLLVAADEIIGLLLSLRGDGRAQLSDTDGQRDLFIRAEVYQAQGMLMVALGGSLEDSLARLRAMAFAEEIDLNELAVDLVAGRRSFPER